jgi:hypothetical protein
VGLRTRERVGANGGARGRVEATPAAPGAGSSRVGGRGPRAGGRVRAGGRAAAGEGHGRCRAGGKGARAGEKGREREREEKGGELTSVIQLRRSPSPKPRAPREREREMGGRERLLRGRNQMS